MPVVDVRALRELAARISSDLKKLNRVATGAASKATKRGVSVLKKNVPVAHGELREDIYADGPLIIVGAPHGAAVNNGSRPHYPPLEPLVAWVKLRGTQGLMTDRQIGRLPGTSTAAAARSVAAMLRGHEANGAMPTDAAEKVARAIQHAIGQHGTKPHHFVEKSMPELMSILDDEMRKAMMQGPDAT